MRVKHPRLRDATLLVHGVAHRIATDGEVLDVSDGDAEYLLSIPEYTRIEECATAAVPVGVPETESQDEAPAAEAPRRVRRGRGE